MTEEDLILENMKRDIVEGAIKRKLMDREQYERKFKGKYIDQFGCDSFINYLSYVMANIGGGLFVTLCEPILRDRKMLEAQFKLPIASPEETIKKIKKKEESK